MPCPRHCSSHILVERDKKIIEQIYHISGGGTEGKDEAEKRM